MKTIHENEKIHEIQIALKIKIVERNRNIMKILIEMAVK